MQRRNFEVSLSTVKQCVLANLQRDELVCNTQCLVLYIEFLYLVFCYVQATYMFCVVVFVIAALTVHAF